MLVFLSMETKQYHGFLRRILLENVLCILAAYHCYQKSKIKGSFFNSPGQRAVKEDVLPVYLSACEYGVPQSMLKDSVHIVSKLSLIKSRVF